MTTKCDAAKDTQAPDSTSIQEGRVGNKSVPLDIDATADKHLGGHTNYHGLDRTQVQPGADAVYEAKIAVLNEALIDIGMGPFQWKIFATTGFGWFVDQLWMQAVSNIQPPVQREFSVQRIAFLSVAKYAGLVIGSSFWPMTADFIGRRLAFNVKLVITAMAGLTGAPTFARIAVLSRIVGFGSGGNQPVDSAIFLEFIPATHQNILVMQSAFWCLGQIVSNMVAWPFIANYCCPADVQPGECSFQDNLGWRYYFWLLGGVTVFLCGLRFFFRIYETPKYLLGRNRDAQAVDVIQKMAARDGKETWLSIEHFQAIDARLAASSGVNEHEQHDINNTRTVMQRSLDKFTPGKFKALFSTPRMAISTTLVLFLRASIGMAFPLYNVFLPIYLGNRGVSTSSLSIDITYRNLAIQALCGFPASILGGYTVKMKRIGRKGTGCLVCLCTSLFLFLFKQAKRSAAVLGFSCSVAFFQCSFGAGGVGWLQASPSFLPSRTLASVITIRLTGAS
ncbi:major facilitator superfamily domain-containing protein [Aspergillus fruticulosus]